MQDLSRHVEDVKSRVTLSVLIGKHIKVTRAGREYKACCPFHGEKTPSFTINDQKGFYHCFGCGMHGDAIGFLQSYLNYSFIEALEQLSNDVGLPLPKLEKTNPVKEEKNKKLHALLEKATQWFTQQLFLSAGAQALAYLKGRGLDETTLAHHQLGYAPLDRQVLRNHLNKLGFSDQDQLAVGLLKNSDRGVYSFFKDRIIFPVHNAKGQIVAFGGRVLEGDGPKYINSPETDLFHKGTLLYGAQKAKKAAKSNQPILVVEGYMDVIALHQAGFEGAVAPLGTALTETQIMQLWKLCPPAHNHKIKAPILCFDGDAAGQRAAWRALTRILPMIEPSQSANFAFMPAGEDPDSLLRTKGRGALEGILNQAIPLIDMLWRELVGSHSFSTPESQAGFKSECDEKIALIKNKSVQYLYQKELNSRFHQLLFQQKRSPTKKSAPILTRPRPSSAQNRREEIFLALMLNHPQLFLDSYERLAELHFKNKNYDRLKQELIILLTQHQTLDSSQLKEYLIRAGFDQDLKYLLSEKIYLHASYARPEASFEDAMQGWLDIWRFIEKDQIHTEITAASEKLGDDLSDGNLNRILALGQVCDDLLKIE